eukprot:COSAG02_NODE_7890_length_2803_cov_4.745932_1_plen_71_part_10
MIVLGAGKYLFVWNPILCWIGIMLVTNVEEREEERDDALLLLKCCVICPSDPASADQGVSCKSIVNCSAGY